MRGHPIEARFPRWLMIPLKDINPDAHHAVFNIALIPGECAGLLLSVELAGAGGAGFCDGQRTIPSHVSQFLAGLRGYRRRSSRSSPACSCMAA